MAVWYWTFWHLLSQQAILLINYRPLWFINYLCLAFFHPDNCGQIDGQISSQAKILSYSTSRHAFWDSSHSHLRLQAFDSCISSWARARISICRYLLLFLCFFSPLCLVFSVGSSASVFMFSLYIFFFEFQSAMAITPSLPALNDNFLRVSFISFKKGF